MAVLVRSQFGPRCSYEPPPFMCQGQCHNFSFAMGRPLVRARAPESYQCDHNMSAATRWGRIARQDCCTYQSRKEGRGGRCSATNYSPSCDTAAGGGRFDCGYGVPWAPSVHRGRHGSRCIAGRATAGRRCSARNRSLVCKRRHLDARATTESCNTSQ